MENEVSSFFLRPPDKIDFRKLFASFRVHWWWILVCLLLSFSCGYIYLMLTDVVYSTSAKIRIIESSENRTITMDMGQLFGNSSVNLENEIADFTSYRLAEQTVRSLNLHFRYFDLNTFKKKEVFNAPIEIIGQEETYDLKEPLSFIIEITKKGFLLTNEDLGVTRETTGHVVTHLDSLGLHFGLRLNPYSNVKDILGNRFEVVVEPIMTAARSLADRISVTPDGERSDILLIEINGTDGVQGEAIVNGLIEEYTKDVIKDKKRVSEQTIKFINERFVYLAYELDSIEAAKSDFKVDNDLFTLETYAAINLQDKREGQLGQSTITDQLALVELLRDELDNATENFKLLPENLGIESGGLSNRVQAYNLAVLEYEKMSSMAGEKNASVTVLGDNIKIMKEALFQYLTAYQEQLERTYERTKKKSDSVGLTFGSLPRKEQLLRDIERQQALKESLYLTLLQKREEAALGLAVINPNVKIIDKAMTDKNPIAPNKSQVWAISFLFGIGLPLGIIFILFTSDDKVYDREDLEHLAPEIPVAGEIPFVDRFEYGTEINDRGPLGEAFRVLNANLGYIMESNLKDSQPPQVILVTSSIPGEGKTFTATHLALSFAGMGKRILLIGADVRNPQLHKYFKASQKTIGLTDYLLDDSKNPQGYIMQPIDELSDNLFVMFPGHRKILNTATLFTNQRFYELIHTLREAYDYIVIDSAPTMLVSDTLYLSKSVDHILQIVKSGFTTKAAIKHSMSWKGRKETATRSFAVNGSLKGKKYGYGNNYGYGYGYSSKNKA
jgi:capsular exopolysaccharide synthesis family protein